MRRVWEGAKARGGDGVRLGGVGVGGESGHNGRGISGCKGMVRDGGGRVKSEGNPLPALVANPPSIKPPKAELSLPLRKLPNCPVTVKGGSNGAMASC